MSAKSNTSESGQEKNLPKPTVQTLPQNLTAIQSLPTVQTVQSGTSSGLQNIQTAQAVTGQATLVGKSIALELNSSKILVKASGSSNINISDNSRITNFGPVRLITQMPTQPQGQQSASQVQQIVTTIGNIHVPLGPAAVANISAPRGTLATPLARAISTNQTIPISRPSVSTTVSSTQWQTKNQSVVYTPNQQQQRHPVPVVTRPSGRPIVYTSSQQLQQQQAQPQQAQPQQAQNQQTQPQLQQPQPRLVNPSQVGRSVQTTVVTATPPRLITPVIQAQNNNITARIPTLTRPSTPQVVNSITQGAQAGRPVAQIIQPNQTSRPLTATPVNRVAVTPPVIGAPNKVATVTSVQTSTGRQLTINAVPNSANNTVSRIIQIPQNLQQQQQSQASQVPSASRVVQAVTSLANFSQGSRVISTSAGVAAGNTQRIPQAGSSVTRLSLHPLPLTPTPAARATTAATHKVTSQASTSIQQVTPKPGTTVTMQAHPHQPQQQQIATLQRTVGNVSSANVVATSVAGQQSGQIQGQYASLPPGTCYSIDASGNYSQFRPHVMYQQLRLPVEQGYEQEPVPKPNASPRPSILRKREQDNSPGKANMSHKPHTLNAGVVKNLVPVLSAMSSSSLVHSPPGSPKGDRDGGGNHSSGSTTVSATSSPGLDEEPEQSRIPMNNISTTIEMSPRKKPRKQQLTGVELIEPRCNEDMQFITEEKIKKEIKVENKDRRQSSNLSDFKAPQPAPVRTKPVPSLIGSSWKNQWSGRLHHYRRPSDVRPREERRPSVNDIAQQKHVLQKVNGWKVYHLTSQMEDFAETERTVHEKLKATLTMLESQQKNRQDEGLEKANELIKGNMQRSNLISEGMNEARVQLTAIFQHKTYVTDLLQRCGSKRSQKKR